MGNFVEGLLFLAFGKIGVCEKEAFVVSDVIEPDGF
jgi:hypothetical protein